MSDWESHRLSTMVLAIIAEEVVSAPYGRYKHGNLSYDLELLISLAGWPQDID
jgi:hypothetical protein